jgi:hypothetical protein
MRLEAKKYLYDIQQAADLLAAFTEGKSFADYQGDAMLRAAVERQFGSSARRWLSSPGWTSPWRLGSASTGASSPSATS